MGSSRPPVTCHILDTVSGKPAAGVLCGIYKLEIASKTEETIITGEYQFALAKTNGDGRVADWIFDPDPSKRETLKTLQILETKPGTLTWQGLPDGTYKIRFFTEQYFRRQNTSSFFPFVDIVFQVTDTRHYHIPLLLSNYGYTTYRGS